MSLTSLTTRKIQLHMPGNSILRAGALVALDYPSIASRDVKNATKDDLLDKYLAGRYLITAVRHKITLTTWESYCELATDTLPNKLPDNFGAAFTLEGL